MACITIDNEIMRCFPCDNNMTKINNNTGYLPLCIRGNVILLSDHKLYTHTTDILIEIKIESGDNYMITNCDGFTDGFAIINFEYYEIYHNLLKKMTIIPKNIFCVISAYMKVDVYTYPRHFYYYIDTDNKLHKKCADQYQKYSDDAVEDSDVDILLLHYNDGPCYYLIYVKNNRVICREYRLSKFHHQCMINYNGGIIKKILGKYLLDVDNKLFVFNFTKIKYEINIQYICEALDFNVYFGRLIILDTNNKLCLINNTLDEFSCTKIDIDGYFKKRITNTKSAANVISDTNY